MVGGGLPAVSCLLLGLSNCHVLVPQLLDSAPVFIAALHLIVVSFFIPSASHEGGIPVAPVYCASNVAILVNEAISPALEECTVIDTMVTGVSPLLPSEHIPFGCSWLHLQILLLLVLSMRSLGATSLIFLFFFMLTTCFLFPLNMIHQL